MSIILFLAVLFVLILVHEWGHYITAKLTGMKVEEFGIGFPPKVWSKKKGETEYSLNALPIGGFVRILGENGLIDEESINPVESEASDRRSEALAEAGEGGQAVQRSNHPDAGRSFGARPKWAQIVVLLAGVTMNMILAWLLITATHTLGVMAPVSEEVASPEAELFIQEVIPGGPSEEVLVPGAVIVSAQAGDTTLDTLTPTGLTEFVNAVGSEPITVSYIFGGEASEAVITPMVGLVEDDPERALIGVRPILVEDQSVGLGEAFKLGTIETLARTQFVFSGLWDLIKTSVAGTADYSQVAGPVGIAVMTDDVAQLGVVALLQFMAMLSISLAVINLLPIPALDGGRIVFVLIEAITGKEIPPTWAGRVNLAGFALLMLLMIAVTYNDIVRLIS